MLLKRGTSWVHRCFLPAYFTLTDVCSSCVRACMHAADEWLVLHPQGLLSLRCLVWLDVPIEARDLLQSQAPQLRIYAANLDVPAYTWLGGKLGFRPVMALDEPYARRIAQYDWEAAEHRREAAESAVEAGGRDALQRGRDMPASINTGIPVSLAERFRSALKPEMHAVH